MLFVSHAKKDKIIIDYFSEQVLRLGFNILSDKIFYSSHPDTGIPGGDYINGTIFSHMQESNLIITFLSANYFDSTYCLCEMGAARLLYPRTKVFLFLLPSLNLRDINGVFSENMIKFINSEGMDSVIDTISNTCKNVIAPTQSGPNRRKEEFLKKFSELMKGVESPQKIPHHIHHELQKKYHALSAELSRAEETIEENNKYIQALEKTKDADEVALIKPKQRMEATNIFHSLIDNAKNHLDKLSTDGKIALFYFSKYGDIEASRRIQKEHLDIDRDIDENFFEISEGSVTPGINSDVIMEIINDLEYSLSDDGIDDICSKFEIRTEDWSRVIADLPIAPFQQLSFWKENLF
ncbi:toll/interleukin-1 receptor domain-containing protein [Desulfolutivibrio sulfoxidireducens]|uniref:toll/interleukin-1 receptor domain-containing protein n=1 Tax=Desulfolutivibrio sulfoxidireducens TaxID=2773299 RepID=UPI00159E1935|nr:hypothetical protein [Desulfolutivibrio sulfoxidireducens]QLA15219.1 TIR domain-containing protein [Desulfolutivibrio sulfoxidireducens]